MTSPLTHRTCPHPACKRNISRTTFACSVHWGDLPQDIRRAISNAWRAGGQNAASVLTPAYRDAADRAMTYWGRAEDGAR